MKTDVVLLVAASRTAYYFNFIHNLTLLVLFSKKINCSSKLTSKSNRGKKKFFGTNLHENICIDKEPFLSNVKRHVHFGPSQVCITLFWTPRRLLVTFSFEKSN